MNAQAKYFSIVAVVFLALAMTIYSAYDIVRDRHADQCAHNIGKIYVAKATWAHEQRDRDESRKKFSAAPSWKDLCGPGLYMDSIPHCPSGGNYDLGPTYSLPRCGLAKHVPPAVF